MTQPRENFLRYGSVNQKLKSGGSISSKRRSCVGSLRGRRIADCGCKEQEFDPAVCRGDLAKIEKTASTSVEGGVVASVVSNIRIAVSIFLSIAIISLSITVQSGERM